MISDILKKQEIGKEKNQEFLEKVNYDSAFPWFKSSI